MCAAHLSEGSNPEKPGRAGALERPGFGRYLHAMWCLTEVGAPASRAGLASLLEVSFQAVSEAIAGLHRGGAVAFEGRDVVLTERGADLARAMVRRVRLVERLVVDGLGFSWRDAVAEVEARERAMSPLDVLALGEQVGEAEVCPHGHVVPASGGPQVVGTALSDLLSGQGFEVLSVFELFDPRGEMLGFLQAHGIQPSRRGEVTWIGVDGAVTVSMGRAAVGIGAAAAERVRVALA